MNDTLGSDGIHPHVLDYMTMPSFKLKVLEDRVVVLMDEQENRTPGGIFFTGVLDPMAPTMNGTVAAIGPGRVTKDGNLIPMHVAVGDRVIYERIPAADVMIEGKKYAIMRESTIVGVFND